VECLPTIKGRIESRKTDQIPAGQFTIAAFALCVALLALSAAAGAQSSRIYRIGYLSSGSSSGGRGGAPEALKRELRKLGYTEAKNITFDYRFAANHHDRLPTLADELAGLKPDVLVAASTTAALAAKSATKNVPIVFFGSGDPVVSGLVKSLARPGGNITGFTGFAAVLAGKRLELLKQTIPTLSRVAVLRHPGNPGSEEIWRESQIPAAGLGLLLYSVEVTRADEMDGAFQKAVKAQSGALAVTISALFTTNRNGISDLAIKHRLPAIYARREFVASGGLMSYGADQAEPYRRVAVFIDKIFKGARPAEIPVEQPTEFELLINLKTAKQIGLTIPPNVLARADRVIK
jgi:putative ABC transport system substrate-binding protein